MSTTWRGKTLGNVLIHDLIARGGMAEVYSGVHTNLNRKVAVKIMRDHVEEDPDSRARFAREARVVAGLDHPNIIQIYDYDLIDGRPCIVMELITGASLANYIKDLQKRGEKLPHPTIARLLKSIAAAVDYAHARNIVHRDIKPANILLRSQTDEAPSGLPLPADVEPVLTDFGLVRLLDSTTQTSTGTVSGTPSYMSPEQARGDRVDHHTDIYSLGVVLYELLAGEVPFDAESSFGVLMKHLNEPPPPIPGISSDMQSIINRALAKNPAHRYNSAGELATEFESVLSGKKVSHKTETLKDILAQETKPKNEVAPAAASRLPLLVGGALILSMLVFAGIWLLRTPQFTTPELDPNQPVGRLRFDDFNYQLDEAIITIGGLPLPEEGTHYDAWLVSQGGQVRHHMGPVQFEGNSGSLSYRDAQAQNLLGLFDQIDITLEPNDDPTPNQPNGEVVASSIFPSASLNYIRNLLVSYGGTPNGDPLIQGLWIVADEVDTSVVELRDAFQQGDEELVRMLTEEIINQLAGEGNPDLYKDWNADGEIADLTDGFGLLPNRDRTGYIINTLDQIRLMIEAADATRNLRENGDLLRACIRNVEESGLHLVELTLSLQNMPFDPNMEAVITEMEITSVRMVTGEDTDNNGNIDLIPSECGADSIYELGHKLTDMPILPGENRTPPSAGGMLPPSTGTTLP